jgi:penicillin-binding protein 1A
MRTLLRLCKFVVTFVAFSLLAATTGIGALYFYFAHDLPNIQSIEDYKPPVVSEVFADDGTRMGEFWIERRLLAPFDEIPRVIIQAFVAAEDARFFEHKGVDVKGIGRALYENLKAGEVVQGGSTITQQVTRSILLTRERSYIRKIKEAILATRIDRSLSKREILEIYLNQIFLGNRAHGIKAAAENYFHKKLADITLAEAAMIAGLTQAPSHDNPIDNPTAAKERQRYVLKRMYEIDYIAKEEMEKADKEPLTVYAASIDKDFNYRFAPYFTEEVRRIVKEKYGEKVLNEGGLKIYTTANIRMNEAAQKAVKNGLYAWAHRRSPYTGPHGHLSEDEIPGYLNKQHSRILFDQFATRVTSLTGETAYP